MLANYDRDRNRPEVDGSSKMSPYLHFGHIGPVTIALAVDAAAKKNPKLKAARDSYFNELIVWRELAVNFVRISRSMTRPSARTTGRRRRSPSMRRTSASGCIRCRSWSRRDLRRALERGADLQMVRYGWMHNYLRMYWAKKILEWTPNVRRR
jgi:deoxyribodipyrimidine photo-lyase